MSPIEELSMRLNRKIYPPIIMTNLIPNEVHYTDHMMPFSLVKDQSFKYVIYHEIPFDNIFQYAFWSPILPLNRVKTV